jgi:hypothetical protein
MSLKDYAVNRDKFERLGNGSGSLTLDFPCCVCFHRFRKDTEEPCRTCDHNCNAVKESPPVQSDQDADEDPHEKDESRAGIRPFEVNAERRAVDEVL